MDIIQLGEVALLLSTSLLFASGFAWLGCPYLLGYIATGIFLGPFIKLIDNSAKITAFGHFGMLMLLFIVGLEFDLIRFKKIWKKAMAIVCLQIIINLVVSIAILYIFKLQFAHCILISFLMTLSSTAVVVKLLEEMNELITKSGSLIISILIMQDLAFVPMMLILKGFCSNIAIEELLLKLFLAIGLLFLLIVYLGRESNKLFSPLRNIFQGNQEIMTLASATVCFGCAAIASITGLSAAYGAFLGGLILGSFGNKLEIMQFALPISSMLIMMFFISIGSQIDLEHIFSNLYYLIFLSLIVLFGKIAINYCIMRMMQIAPKKSLFASIMLSQVSEFAFALIAILANVNILSIYEQKLLISLTIISLTIGSIFPVLCHFWFRNYLKEQF